MTELYLSIADIRAAVTAEAFGTLEILADYTTQPQRPDHCFRAELAEHPLPPAGELVYMQPALRVYRSGGRVMRYGGEVSGSTEGAHQWSVLESGGGVLSFRRDKLPQGITGKQLLHAMDLPHLLTIHDGFLLHAAYIQWEGRAILFTAPSGTGKSTQAQLWCDHMGAELVNGDRAAVRIVDGEVFAFGIPFCGSSQVRRNVKRPLEAIVYLSQAPENSITRLRGVRAFRRVWEGCTVNTWEREDVEKATMTVSEAVSRVPVYHLSCTPDVRAAETLKNIMEVEK